MPWPNFSNPPQRRTPNADTTPSRQPGNVGHRRILRPRQLHRGRAHPRHLRHHQGSRRAQPRLERLPRCSRASPANHQHTRLKADELRARLGRALLKTKSCGIHSHRATPNWCAPMIGQVLGHYRIDAKLGEGGMGVVYRARDEFLHRDVALKILSKGTVPTDSARDYLLHEARSSSALSHPNICTIHEVSELNGELYIVMELVEGKPLNTLIAGEGLPVESLLRYGVQIAAALSHSHSRNIIHGDLTSSNIVVTPARLVKVLDFGLAQRSEVDLLEGATQTIGPLDTAQGLTGTLQYMAPEMLRGLETDHRIDIWALGVVLYEAASGQLPFKGRTAFEISSAILHDLPPQLPSRIPTRLCAIIQRCLAKEPAQRYQ